MNYQLIVRSGHDTRERPEPRLGAFFGRSAFQPLRLVISSVACGNTVLRSPTTPKSTSSKIGASSSLLTATIVFDVCMPARCWMAPEMPLATYSCGETVLPVCPIWEECGYQPESTAARDAPTAAPSESPNASASGKSRPVPPPPDTTTEASVTSGRPVASFGFLEVMFAALAAPELSTETAAT